MTTAKNRSELGTNPALENTEGVPLDGFQDPTGEFPKREYNYGSSINKAARGLKVNELYVSGGDIGVSLNIEDQEPSQYPFNQVKETASGHVVEYDDTPGGERILIKHRKGAGVEMRADGSIIISAINNKVEVTGGDQTLIVEGNGNLVYKGNLNLTVTGDYNVDVGGNYNVNVAGHSNEDVQLNKRTTVSGDTEYTTKGAASVKTLENKAELVIGDYDVAVKGYSKTKVEGEVNLFTDNRLIVSAKDELSMVSQVANISAATLSVLGMRGAIGGEQIEFTGPVYMGPKGAKPFTSGAAFYGSFHGQATEAIRSYNANKADKAKTAYSAQFGKVKGGPGGSNPSVDKATESQENPFNIRPIPLAQAIGGMLTMGDFSVRTVTVDPDYTLKYKILLRDDYQGLFEKIPTTQEIRSKMRDPANRSLLAADMVALGHISSTYNNPTPKKIGRTSAAKPSARFGYIPLGNAIANRGKRFRP
jgi:hypothetical protein